MHGTGGRGCTLHKILGMGAVEVLVTKLRAHLAHVRLSACWIYICTNLKKRDSFAHVKFSVHGKGNKSFPYFTSGFDDGIDWLQTWRINNARGHSPDKGGTKLSVASAALPRRQPCPIVTLPGHPHFCGTICTPSPVTQKCSIILVVATPKNLSSSIRYVLGSQTSALCRSLYLKDSMVDRMRTVTSCAGVLSLLQVQPFPFTSLETQLCRCISSHVQSCSCHFNKWRKQCALTFAKADLFCKALPGSFPNVSHISSFEEERAKKCWYSRVIRCQKEVLLEEGERGSDQLQHLKWWKRHTWLMPTGATAKRGRGPSYDMNVN